MILTPRILGRIALVLFVGTILQLGFFSELSIAGSTPDLVPVMVITMGLLGGSLTGAVVGFVLGLFVDAVLVQTLGASSLTYLAIGYLAGRIRETWDIGFNSLVPPLITGGLTLVGVASFAAIQFMLGVDAPVSVLVIRDIFVKGILAVFLAIPGYYGIKRAVRPALVEDGRTSRARPGVHLGAA